MKFGMLVIPSAAKGTSFPEAIAQCIEQAEIAEANGFDFCLVPEHHQSRGFIHRRCLWRPRLRPEQQHSGSVPVSR